jgi:hypothetical protein
VLIPRIHQIVAVQTKVANDIADFVRRKPGIDSDSQIMQPNLRFETASANVNVRGLGALVGVEERPIGTPS